MFGSVDDNYKWVPVLKLELINRNPGSHITYQCDNKNNSFKRFFVSFKVCIDGLLAGCRYLIGLDACHLKSKYLGVLLSGNCLDGNNGLFTIAFAVAESESKKSWEWFMINLATSFILDIEHISFISDMEKGLGEAIKVVFPNAEHRVCMRHLWKNIKKHIFVGTNHHNLWHTYVDEHYYSFRYRMAYEGPISTLPGKEQWSKPIDSIFVSPPVSIRPRGRQKKRRIKNLLEGAKKAKTSHRCGRCNSWGHHRSTCKEPLSLDDENVQPVLFGKIPIQRANSQTDAT
ncbi:hypothetical protein KFK09_009674 [Dendrobium nobile]|uniref:MULE transposase domain-containing protein n=1 Tax=Dendrobium nobile TaxID=94219 RepID=A0A8T3BI33_DENNO|nr:hypothetical protein KFK09_009674 [Dendrobium nobile]